MDHKIRWVVVDPGGLALDRAGWKQRHYQPTRDIIGLGRACPPWSAQLGTYDPIILCGYLLSLSLSDFLQGPFFIHTSSRGSCEGLQLGSNIKGLSSKMINDMINEAAKASFLLKRAGHCRRTPRALWGEKQACVVGTTERLALRETWCLLLPCKSEPPCLTPTPLRASTWSLLCPSSSQLFSTQLAKSSFIIKNGN